MAKLTARGTRPLRTFSVLYREGYEMNTGYVLDESLEVFFVLRSDGCVLSNHCSPDRPTSYERRRCGYTLKGKLRGASEMTVTEMVAAFDNYRNLKAKGQPDAIVSHLTTKSR